MWHCNYGFIHYYTIKKYFIYCKAIIILHDIFLYSGYGYQSHAPSNDFFPFQKLRFDGRQSNVSMTMTASGVSGTTISSNISNTRDSVSSGCPNTEKRVENTTRSGVFLTKFEVFGYPDETLSLVFDILLLKLINNSSS